MSAEDNSNESMIEECRHQIVEHLEHVLELATAGEIVGIAIATVETGGRQSTCMIGYDQQTAMIAAVTVLQYRVVKSALENNVVMH